MMINYRLNTFTAYTHYKVFMHDLFLNIAEKHVTDLGDDVIMFENINKSNKLD